MAKDSTGQTRGGARGPAQDPTTPHILREYALLADGHRGALIGPRGDISWLCAPRWDSEAVFTTLLGGGGRYTITPADPRFVWGGYYDEGSLIWNSRWVTTAETIESREALALPSDEHRLVLVRQVHAIEGDGTVRVRLEPRSGFGRHGMRNLRRDDAGVWTGRTGDLYVRWSGAADIAPDDGGVLDGVLHVPDGARHNLVLEISTAPFDQAPPDADTIWHTTQHAWHSGTPVFAGSIARRDARHAHAVLRGLTSPGGGMVAAATTSLPERARAGRSYDYRYAWIRDQCFAGQSAAVAGLDDLLDSAVAFVGARLLEDGPEMMPAYTVTGGAVPPEEALDFLPGYPGGEVKTGNWIRGQFQLDAFGEALSLFAAAARRDRLDTEAWRAVEVGADAIAKRWQDPDAGVWELDNQHWTHSRLSCVAGLRAVAKVAPATQGGRWSSLADTILAQTDATSLHPSGRWQRSPDDERVDAALLLPALRGALTPDDPRTTATKQAIMRDLAQDGYMYRFRQDERPLGAAEGAFLLCSLLAALSAEQDGDAMTAGRWFERSRAACGPPGLYSEEYDVEQRQLRGNLPQAFVHAFLLECAVTLTHDHES